MAPKKGPTSVAASLLAKNAMTPRLARVLALSLTFFASKLAPTGRGVRVGRAGFPAPWPVPFRLPGFAAAPESPPTPA
ncbi:hypothetical protein FJ692_20360 [Pseudomonas fluorescens]|nr:hypothetical protein C1751_12345 [Pseudomonas fluorescens]TPV54638.1 hypothetical protein FJ692_20360 [Pseudomonas fluorescens]